MRYAPRIRTARLQVVADELPGGVLILRSEGGQALATVPIEDAAVDGDEIVLLGDLRTRAIARGRPSRAELRSDTDEIVADELRVGGEVKIDALSLVEGQTVRLLEARIRHG